jgi:hypothetical protein
MITPGELRGRTQPTILLRMTNGVDAAPGNTDGEGAVFRPGLVVFAQYIGNGRLLLTPVDPGTGWGPQVVMASALNSTAEIIPAHELEKALTGQGAYT